MDDSNLKEFARKNPHLNIKTTKGSDPLQTPTLAATTTPAAATSPAAATTQTTDGAGGNEGLLDKLRSILPDDFDLTSSAMGAGGALVAHAIAASMLENENDRDGRRRNAWSRLASKLLSLGAAGLGAHGGYRLGKMIKDSSADGSEESEGEGQYTYMYRDGKPWGPRLDQNPVGEAELDAIARLYRGSTGSYENAVEAAGNHWAPWANYSLSGLAGAGALGAGLYGAGRFRDAGRGAWYRIFDTNGANYGTDKNKYVGSVEADTTARLKADPAKRPLNVRGRIAARINKIIDWPLLDQALKGKKQRQYGHTRTPQPDRNRLPNTASPSLRKSQFNVNPDAVKNNAKRTFDKRFGKGSIGRNLAWGGGTAAASTMLGFLARWLGSKAGDRSAYDTLDAKGLTNLGAGAGAEQGGTSGQ